VTCYRQDSGAKIDSRPADAMAPLQVLARQAFEMHEEAAHPPPGQSPAPMQLEPARVPPTQVLRQLEAPRQLLPASMPPEHEEPQSPDEKQAWFTLGPPEQ
jgi:hypothetical protein